MHVYAHERQYNSRPISLRRIKFLQKMTEFSLYYIAKYPLFFMHFTKNDGNQSILCSLVSVIFYELFTDDCKS